MNSQAIYHRPKSNFCYAYNEDTVHIRLRAARGDLKKVILVHGDKYLWDEREEITMKLTSSDSLFDYFTAEVKVPTRRLAYYFLVTGDEGEFYYTEWGISKELDDQEIHLHLFQYPFLNKIDIHKVPEWVKDAVFYQIFPERFENGDRSNDPERVERWGEKPAPSNFFGGDIRGIIDKLDYIEDLGINAVYLTPVFEATTNHKYDTVDYLKIDPHFGDKETMKELVDSCHKKGIKVVLDAVFNHSGYYFGPFQDVVQKGKNSIYYNWFHIQEYPIETNPPNYDTFATTWMMPKLNTENEEVREYLLKVSKYWIEEVGIDGWRLDVANEIDHDFWRDFRRVVKAAKEDAYIVGEIWHESLPWLQGDQYDAVMNYPFMKICVDYFAHDDIDANSFRESINEIQMRNTKQVNEVMLNLIDSHDTARFLTIANGDINRLKLAAAFQLTYPGTPSIYYGTEIGMEGGHDPDCRRTMIWEEDKWNKDLYTFYKDLIKLRKEYSSLSKGSFKWIEEIVDIIGFERELGEEKVIVLINKLDEDKEIKFKTDGLKYKDLLNNEVLTVESGQLNMIIPKHFVKILTLSK